MSTNYKLAYGTHATPDEGRCAMEGVSYLAGEPHGDQPACVSPVLRAFCTTLNDRLEKLRVSAFCLLDRMLPTVPLAPPVADDADQLCSRAALLV